MESEAPAFDTLDLVVIAAVVIVAVWYLTKGMFAAKKAPKQTLATLKASSKGINTWSSAHGPCTPPLPPSMPLPILSLISGLTLDSWRRWLGRRVRLGRFRRQDEEERQDAHRVLWLPDRHRFARLHISVGIFMSPSWSMVLM
jgi:hypothetical protein